MTLRLDPELREYATEEEWGLLEVWVEKGSARKAQEFLKLEVGKNYLSHILEAVEKRAGQHGYAPDRDLVHKTAPGMSSRGTSIRYDGDGHVQQYWNKSKQEGRDPDAVVRLPDPKTIVKLSTNYDAEGNVVSQWIAEKPEAIAQVKAWQEYAKELTKNIEPVEPIAAPEITDSDLMACFPVGDHHMGMLAWGEETGDSWDLKIGEQMLTGATNYLMERSPIAGIALLAFLGDFMHYDSFEPVTPKNRNILDADSRFPKMVRVSLRAMRYMIKLALKVYGAVHVIIEIGNHDLSSSIFLMEALWNIYENEPRVTVDTSPMHFHYYRFGKNLIGTHHGHGVKMASLPLIMATDRKEDWGETTHRMWWTGHYHTQKTQVGIGAQDFSGCTVEQFRVLAATDAYASQKGYRAIRGMQCIMLHKEFGEMARHTVSPEMFAIGED